MTAAPKRVDGADGCVIGLDLGTSAIKGVLVDAGGAILQYAEQAIEYDRPGGGMIQIDAWRYRDLVYGVIRRLGAAAPAPVRALAAASASGNTLLTDAAGEPLTPIINWMDSRTAARRPSALAGLSAAEVRQVTGWPCIDSFSLAHLGWFRDERPDLFRSAAHCAMNTDWLGFQLTGRWALDYSTATPAHLQDQVARTYHAPFLARLGIAESQLSGLIPSGTPIGPLRAGEAARTGLSPGTVWVSGSFDHPAAARAVGVCEPGLLLLSCGTSWVGFFPEADRQAIIDAEWLCDPFLSSEGGPWGAMFSLTGIGETIDRYVRKQVAPGESDPYRVFNEAAAAARAGAGGVTLDLLAPVAPVAASREDLSRAVMEAAAGLLAGRLHAIEKRGAAFRRAVLVGGPSRSPVWMEIVSEKTGLALEIDTPHAGARGAALLAGRGVNLFPAASVPQAKPSLGQ